MVTYKPLILVFAYILLVTLAIEVVNGSFELHQFMPNFMAGFFGISFFKMLDLAGFASSLPCAIYSLSICLFAALFIYSLNLA